MTISHNLLAMNAQRQYKINTDSKKKSTEKLSSGYKINRAADDAAGLTISEKMRSQIRGLTQGVTNCHDGVSMCQIGDGALEEVQDMLHRLTELSIKSANGTNTQADRDAIQKEVNQILNEINRIDESTEFNTLPIFGKGNANSTLSTGTASPSYIINDTSLSIPSDFSSVSVSAANINTLLTQNADGSYQLESGKNYTFSSDVSNVRFNIDSSSSVIPGNTDIGVAISNSNLTDCAITCSDGANLYLKDVIINNTAALSAYDSSAPVTLQSSSTLNFIGNVNLSIAINSHSENPAISIPSGETGYINGNGFLNAIGGAASAGIGGREDTGTIVINSGNIYAQGVGGAGIGGGWGCAFDDIIINGGQITAIGYAGAAGIGSGDAGHQAQLYSTITINGGNIIAKSMDAGAGIGGGHNSSGFDVFINNGDILAIGSNGGAGIGSGWLTATAINKLNSGTVNITGGNVKAVGSINAMGSDEERNHASAIGQGAIWVPGGSSTQAYDKWRENFKNVIIDGISYDSFIIGRDSSSMENGNYVYNYGNTSNLDESNNSGNGTGYWIQAGSHANDGFYITFDDVSTQALGIDNLDVSTQDNARKAISKIDGALANVSANRSHIGAQQNRLESTIRNEDNIVENTTAAESRIRDTDMAAEMVNLTKQNILAQVGESMISQANQSNQGVLTLLGS